MNANECVNVHTYKCQSNIRRRCIYILEIMRLGYIKHIVYGRVCWYIVMK